MYQQDVIIGCILFVCLSCYGVIGAAHHVKYGIVEWIFIRLNRNTEAKKVMVDLYKSGPVTRACYVGYLIYIFTCLFAIFTGMAHVPIWAAIFTVLPIFIALAPFRIIGTLHISAILTFIGWMILLGV